MLSKAEVAERTMKFLPPNRPADLSDIRLLFQSDPELLYQLCTVGLPENAASALNGLLVLVHRLAVLMRDGFEITSRAGTQIAEVTQGGILVLCDPAEDKQFLRALYTGDEIGKSLTGEEVSRDRIEFRLGSFDWENSARSTAVLRLAPDDAATAFLPKHQYLELIDCAREVVRNPLKVWKGLREGDNQRRAYCGRPSRRWLNSGAYEPPPDGYVYMVYADRDGYVFDWDWVKCDADGSGFPDGHRDRFGAPVDAGGGELLVGNLAKPKQFEASRPAYSISGDCVFYYFDEAEAHAQRIDEYLTVFVAFKPGEENATVGFKLKHVRRLLDTVEKWARNRDEGILIHYDDHHPDRVSVSVSFLMQAWLQANLPFIEDLAPAMDLMDLMARVSPLLKTVRKAGDPRVAIPRSLLEATAA